MPPRSPSSAACAAPSLLGRAGALRDRRFSPDLAAHPTFEHAFRVDAPAVRDGLVITGLGSRVFHVTALLIAALAGEEPARVARWRSHWSSGSGEGPASSARCYPCASLDPAAWPSAPKAASARRR